MRASKMLNFAPLLSERQIPRQNLIQQFHGCSKNKQSCLIMRSLPVYFKSAAELIAPLVTNNKITPTHGKHSPSLASPRAAERRSSGVPLAPAPFGAPGRSLLPRRTPFPPRSSELAIPLVRRGSAPRSAARRLHQRPPLPAAPGAWCCRSSLVP